MSVLKKSYIVGIIFLLLALIVGISMYKDENTTSIKKVEKSNIIQTSSGSNATKKNKTDMEKFLMDNPDILFAALENMQTHFQGEEARERESAVQSNMKAIYQDKRDYVIGKPNAPITIVEFFDYNCGYCKRAFPTVLEVIKNNDDVRVVFKEMPILGASSKQAAQVALASKNAGKYFDVHKAFFEAKGSLNSDYIAQIIKDNNLDVEKTILQSLEADIEEHISDTLNLAVSLDITGTPAFIINNKVYPGAMTYENMQQVINEARETAQN